jgi:hypothetical protein
MEQMFFGRWRLCSDREATRRAYKCVEIAGPEACGCSYCRNFAAARDQVYPAEVRSLFGDLGIDPCREAEVYHMCRLKSGLHLYGGWFHFVGRIEEEGEEVGKFCLEGGTGPFNLFFHEKPVLVPDPFQGLPLVQLEFTAQAPWILEEPEPE